MSRDTGTDDLNHQAFEFVIGTLRGADRRAFAEKIAADTELARQVHFWEEHLMALPPAPQIPPAPQTWQKIAARVSADPNLTSNKDTTNGNAGWWRLKNWLAPSLLGSICTLLVVFSTVNFSTPAGSEYIAVLSDSQGRPALTAITQGDTANMRIQWQPVPIAAGKNLQLWAVSKRDGQARSLAVFSAPTGAQLQLDIPQLRLIKDADSLLLTEEDLGGSAIDEPSSVVVAKGICVRFAAQ